MDKIEKVREEKVSKEKEKADSVRDKLERRFEKVGSQKKLINVFYS